MAKSQQSPRLPLKLYGELSNNRRDHDVPMEMLMSGRISGCSSRYLTASATTPSRPRTCASASGRTFIQTRSSRVNRSTVIRAVRHIASQRPEIQWLYSQRLGGSLCLPARRGDVVRDRAIKSRPVSTVSQPTIALEQRRGSLAPRTRRRKLPKANRSGRRMAEAGRNLSRPTRAGMIRIFVALL